MLEPRIRPIYQRELADCGFACLAMVANHHGHDLDLHYLHKAYGTSLTGLTAKRIVEIAAELGLSCQGYKVEMDSLGDVPLPAILHWRNNHYVVLEDLTENGGVIVDPARGRRECDLEEIARQFSGVSLCFEKTPAFAAVRSPRRPGLSSLMSIALSDLESNQLTVGAVVAFTVLIQAATLILPLAVQLTIDAPVSMIPRQVFSLSLAFAALVLGTMLLRVLRDRLYARISGKVAHTLSRSVLDHLEAQPHGFFQKRAPNQLLGQVKAVEAVARALPQAAFGASANCLSLIGATIVLLAYDLRLAVLSVAISAAQGIAKHVAAKKQADADVVALKAAGPANSTLIEIFRNRSAAHRQQGSTEQRQRWEEADRKERCAREPNDRRRLLLEAADTAASGFGLIAILCVGALLMIQEAISGGMLAAALLYRRIADDSLTSIAAECRRMSSLRSRISNMSDVLPSAPGAPGAPAAQAPQAPQAPQASIAARFVSSDAGSHKTTRSQDRTPTISL